MGLQQGHSITDVFVERYGLNHKVSYIIVLDV